MVAAYIALFSSLICVIFLIVILFRIKKEFNSKDIVEKSRIYMERMVADMNKNAVRDIDLVNQNSKQLRELLLQAENTIKSFNEATDRLRSMIGEAERFGSTVNSVKPKLQPELTVHYEENKNVTQLKTISQRNKEAVVSKYKSGMNQSENKESVPFIYTQKVENESASKSFIDVSHSKRSLSDKVGELFAKGYPVEEIARQLSCSVTEVQTIIDLEI